MDIHSIVGLESQVRGDNKLHAPVSVTQWRNGRYMAGRSTLSRRLVIRLLLASQYGDMPQIDVLSHSMLRGLFLHTFISLVIR